MPTASASPDALQESTTMTRVPVEERRTALLEASIRVIERDGYTETTTRTIAAEANMPLASLHYVFASRQELIAATLKLMSPQIVNGRNSTRSLTTSPQDILEGRITDLDQLI